MLEGLFHSKEEGDYQIFKQPGLRQPPAVPAGVFIPRESGWNVKREREKVENTRVHSSGFRPVSAQGNYTTQAGGTIIYNYDQLGLWLAAACDGLTSAAFTGVLRVEVTDGGSGYTATPNVAIAGATGAGATATAVVVGGQVEAVIITNHGAAYTAPMTVTFTGGGGGAGAAATAILAPTKFKHTGVPQIGEPDYYLIQKGVKSSTYWRRYFDMVLRKLSFNDTASGICSLTDDWMGSGHMTKANAQLDGTASEITGAPGGYGGLCLLHDGTVGLLAELTTDIECNLLGKRGPMSIDGKASALRRGGWTTAGSGKAWFVDEAFDDDIEDDVLMTFMSVNASDAGSFTRTQSEVQCTLGDWETTDEGIVYPFSYDSVVDTGTASIAFTLINDTASY